MVQYTAMWVLVNNNYADTSGGVVVRFQLHNNVRLLIATSALGVGMIAKI